MKQRTELTKGNIVGAYNEMKGLFSLVILLTGIFASLLEWYTVINEYWYSGRVLFDYKRIAVTSVLVAIMAAWFIVIAKRIYDKLLANGYVTGVKKYDAITAFVLVIASYVIGAVAAMIVWNLGLLWGGPGVDLA